jgi:hypothetical protein
MKRWASNPKFAPKSKSKRAVNRRARQTKSPNRMNGGRSSGGSAPVGTSVGRNTFGDRVPIPSMTGLSWSRLNKVYDFVQFIDGGSLSTPGPIVTSTTLNTNVAWYFTLNQLAQAGSFGALFDQYRIAMVEVLIKTRVNAQTAFGSNAGFLFCYEDFDDAALPTLGTAEQRANAQCTAGYESQVHRFVPHVANAVYSGAFTSFGNSTAPWIDCASLTVQHYGLKAVWTPTSAVMTWDVVARVHLQFRNVV